MTEKSSTKAPLREFGSIQKSHTPENLEKARDTLTRAQGMDWKADEEPNCPHKTPCFPVADVEWLFAYVDALEEREKSIYAWAKAARTKGSGLPPSRALRWIDELGDRIIGGANPQEGPS
jgi:hypothetical protein